MERGTWELFMVRDQLPFPAVEDDIRTIIELASWN
jgi:hypothetical protein